MYGSMSFMQDFSDAAYYSMAAPGDLNGGSTMTFGVVCAVRLGTAAGTIQRFWGNWEDTGDTGWCVQKSAASIATAAGQIWDMEAGAAGDTISGDAPAEPQSALYRPVFLVGVIDTSGDESLTMYMNGTVVATDADITSAAGGDIYLGRGSEDDVPGEDIKVNMVFLHTAALTAIQIANYWHQIERYGRLDPNTNIEYYWDLIDNKDPGATWTSRGAAATALTLTGTGHANLAVESWTNTGFAL
jgi:hypothetical protein